MRKWRHVLSANRGRAGAGDGGIVRDSCTKMGATEKNEAKT